jgi:hypothetical protein
MSLSAAGVDLGLGVDLQSQMEDEVAQRKKKLAQNAAATGGQSAAAMALGVGMNALG